MNSMLCGCYLIDLTLEFFLSGKEEQKTHICGIQENGTGKHTGKAEMESQMQRTNSWLPRREMWGGMNWETGTDMYIDSKA